MNFLPILRPVALLVLAATFCSCETAANRRELYTSTTVNGPWHDYERRRDAEAETGSTGVAPLGADTSSHGRPTKMPPSAPLPMSAPAPSGPVAPPPPPPLIPDAVPGTPPVPAPVVPAPAPDAGAPAPATPQ